MSKHLLPFDISNHPDLLQLAEEVNTTKSPRKLMRDNETLAVVMPVGTTLPVKKKRAKTKADYEAFKSAAGAGKTWILTSSSKISMLLEEGVTAAHQSSYEISGR